MKENNKSDLWVRICLIPLLIGFSLVVAKISMFIFKVIGWFLLIFGMLTGLFYLIKLYRANGEKIIKFLEGIKLKLLRKKIKWQKKNH